ncbi:putative F-box/kelch-repeat protein At4g39600 [Brassica napus]|uniref:putative F-box/kelch-repeat protein At4g39600 n=1 Tax=Brassica napus TaxID=3708 RepID=UPI00207A1F73|nr:putative F-box/kelch-repeat protein At4g39600 [Brassica napus]
MRPDPDIVVDNLPVHSSGCEDGSLLNRTEKCLYVCLQFPTEPNLRWFTLCRKPDKTVNKTESLSGNILVPVQIRNSPPIEWSNLVAVDHKLYAINKEDDVTSCSSNVFFLDCRTHTWVVEGLVDSASGRSVFLTKDLVEFGSACLIEKIDYCYGSTGEFLWSNNSAEVDGWKKVEGLEGLSKLARYSNVNLVDCGGKMLVFWDKYVPAGNKEKMIWCAEISLEMRSSGEQVWGKVEWFDAVLKVPKSYKFVYSIAATV